MLPERRTPRSVQELQRVSQVPALLHDNFALTTCLRSLESLSRQAHIYQEEGNLEDAFIHVSKAAQLAIQHIPKHPDFASLPPQQRALHRQKSNALLRALTELKSIIASRFDEWQTANPSSGKCVESQQNTAPAHAQTSSLFDNPNASSAATHLPYERAPSPNNTLPYWSAPKMLSSAHLFTASTRSQITTLPYNAPVKEYADWGVQQTGSSRLGANQAAQRFAPSVGSKIDYPVLQSVTRDAQPSFVQNDDQQSSMRILDIPKNLPNLFLALALDNTDRKLETCGLLLGRLSRNTFTVTCLLIPKQKGSTDQCETCEEELIFDYQDKAGLLTLGWIHTHPTQSCFLSSLDLHTHYGYQLGCPEAIAIVCAPSKTPAIGIFRIIDPEGMQTIGSCHLTGFHPHPADAPLYTDADGRLGHVRWTSTDCSVVDLR